MPQRLHHRNRLYQRWTAYHRCLVLRWVSRRISSGLDLGRPESDQERDGSSYINPLEKSQPGRVYLSHGRYSVSIEPFETAMAMCYRSDADLPILVWIAATSQPGSHNWQHPHRSRRAGFWLLVHLGVAGIFGGVNYFRRSARVGRAVGRDRLRLQWS